MKIRALKYATPVILYALAWIAFTQRGWLTWIPLFEAWIFIPILELLIRPNPRNLPEAEEQMAKEDPVYDWLLYMVVILQFAALFYFFKAIAEPGLKGWEITGRIFSMGLLCGTFGINVAHELGHRVNKVEKALAKSLLLTSLYMHFFIEHNKGHHKHVATHNDPGSARYNEPVYIFYLRTIMFSWLSAWRIANEEMKKKGIPVFGWQNEMLQMQIIQLAFLAIIFNVYGWITLLYFFAASLIGICLLEAVNYIEHYGLSRKQTGDGKYERAMPWHSWNSNHLVGRIMLFELSRHSDHHYMASRKYQVLRHHDDAPQLPTGYPGSILLAMIPPAWFYVMNKKVRKLNAAKH